MSNSTIVKPRGLVCRLEFILFMLLSVPPEVGVKGNDTKSQNTLDVAWGHQMWGGYARYSVETLAFVINDFKN